MAARNSLFSARFRALAPLGATADFVRRITDGDARAALTELRAAAERGDAVAIHLYAHLSRIECDFAHATGVGSKITDRAIRDANALPPDDAEWLRTVVTGQAMPQSQLAAACDETVDRGQAETWLRENAERGDPTGHYLLGWLGYATDRSSELHEAANGGLPAAEYGYSKEALRGAPVPGDVRGDGAAEAADLLRDAALSLPEAESFLALCEFNGCPGIAVDPDAGIWHAREAAQRGAMTAILQMGPRLQASQMDPDEVAAWGLLQAAVGLQGCSLAELRVHQTQSWMEALASTRISESARSLADEYWATYGAQILETLGCDIP